MLLDGDAQLGVLGVLLERGLEVGRQDAQLALAGAPRAALGPGEAVPGPREGQEVGAAAATVGGEHRAHPAAAVGVGAHDDLVGQHALEHCLARARGEAVDGGAEVFDRPSAAWHKLTAPESSASRVDVADRGPSAGKIIS